MLRRIKSHRGFTLIELLVVLVILALLAGIVLPKFLDQGKKAKRSAATSQIANFKTAIQLFAVDNGQVPTTQQGLDALIHQPGSMPNWKKYMQDLNEIPMDPWGNPYKYEAPGPNGDDYLITSLGADGKEGGTGDDEDITSNASSSSK